MIGAIKTIRTGREVRIAQPIPRNSLPRPRHLSAMIESTRDFLGIAVGAVDRLQDAVLAQHGLIFASLELAVSVTN